MSTTRKMQIKLLLERKRPPTISLKNSDCKATLQEIYEAYKIKNSHTIHLMFFGSEHCIPIFYEENKDKRYCDIITETRKEIHKKFREQGHEPTGIVLNNPLCGIRICRSRLTAAEAINQYTFDIMTDHYPKLVPIQRTRTTPESTPSGEIVLAKNTLTL